MARLRRALMCGRQESEGELCLFIAIIAEGILMTIPSVSI